MLALQEQDRNMGRSVKLDKWSWFLMPPILPIIILIVVLAASMLRVRTLPWRQTATQPTGVSTSQPASAPASQTE
jgi:hypothetical protein